jgi:ammonia channel protein AmtB
MIYEGIWHDLAVCAVGVVLWVLVGYRISLARRRIANSKE